MTLLVVAPTHAEAQQYISDAGLGLQNPTIITAGSPMIRGYSNGTVIVLSRSRLPMTMENELSMLAQHRGLVIVTIPEQTINPGRMALDTLDQMPPDAFLASFMKRFGPGEHRVALGTEYVISIREALQPPEFATAEEALEWLDQQSPEVLDRAARLKQAEDAKWYGGSVGPVQSKRLSR